MQSDKRLIVIGLDCLEPSLAFERWADRLPNLTRLCQQGSYGRMRSIIPPITVPAWQCMMTSQDPGTLGIYGFRNRRDHSYDGLSIASGKQVRALRVWDVLSRAGKKNIVFGVPLTYPPRPLSGVMISGFPLPGTDVNYTYPVTLKQEIDEVVDYIPDVRNFRTENKEEVLAELIEMAKRRFRLAEHLLETKPWQFFMMVEMGTDRIVHLLWRYSDPEHRYYEPGHPLEHALRDYYVLCDELIGRLIAPYEKDPDTAVMLVSDHGARGMDGGIRINEWLIQQGYLKLKARPDEPCGMTRLIENDLVDWSQTKAWAEGGYYARVMFNVRDREPEGILAPEDVESFRNQLADEIRQIPDHEGNPLATQVHFPETTYQELKNIPPDLVVIFDDLGWRAIGSVSTDEGQPLHVFENDTGPDDANHAWDGVFVASGGGLAAHGELDTFSLLDFAPTVLEYFGAAVPASMQGTPIPGLVRPGAGRRIA